MNLDQLLRDWANREPDRCKYEKDEHSEVFYIGWNKRFAPIWAAHLGNIQPLGLMEIQAAVQETIAQQKLLFKLENSYDGIYYARVMENQVGLAGIGQGQEPGIVLLQAYLNWLSTEVRNE